MYLKGIWYQLPFLQIFIDQVHSRVISSNRLPIQNFSVKQYLRSVGEIFAEVGTTDPQFNTVVRLDFWMGLQMVAYVHQDNSTHLDLPPPSYNHELSLHHFPRGNTKKTGYRRPGLDWIFIPPSTGRILPSSIRICIQPLQAAYSTFLSISIMCRHYKYHRIWSVVDNKTFGTELHTPTYTYLHIKGRIGILFSQTEEKY